MRSTRELVLATLAIVAAVAGLHYWRTSRPSQVSGTAVDISTGLPIPGVRVRPKFLNGHGEGVLADSQGRFTLPVSVPSWMMGMFVDSPHYAGLFGKVVGREDHSFLLGNCNDKYLPTYLPVAPQRFPKEQQVWASLLYPQADKLSDAQPVIAMPGQRISGLNFRLRRTTGFLLQGRFVWTDGDSPKLLDLYSNDFSATNLDLGLEPNQTTNSRCGWNTYPGVFECIHMPPGNYRLRMTISPVWVEADRGHRQRQNDQGGETVLHLGDIPPKPVALEMRKLFRRAAETGPKKPAETGWLDVHLSGCGSYEFRRMTFQIWDDSGRPASIVSTPQQGTHAWQREVKPGRYRVSAVCRAYWGRGENSYLEEILRSNGTPAQVRSGLTTQLDVHALSAEEIYLAAMAYLSKH